MGTEQVEFSVLHLIMNSSGGVQFIMFILFISSIISWKLIFEYSKKIKVAEKEFDVFNQNLKGGKGRPAKPINFIYSEGKIRSNAGIYKVFIRSFKFINNSSVLLTTKLKEDDNKETNEEIYNKKLYEYDLIDIYEETFKAEIDIAEQNLKNSLATLGTISSTAPYVGLLGTVYGILIAFWGLGMEGQATIATVAPSIAEALIATGMGLFVAIPALVFYNKLNHRVDILIDQYDQVLQASKLLLKRNVLTTINQKG